MCQAHWCLENFRRRWTDKRWADELRRHFQWKFSTLKNLESRPCTKRLWRPTKFDGSSDWMAALIQALAKAYPANTLRCRLFIRWSSHLMRQRVSYHEFQISEFRRTQRNSERTTRKNPGRKPKTSTARQTIDMLKCLRNGSFEGSIWKKLYLKIHQKEH